MIVISYNSRSRSDDEDELNVMVGHLLCSVKIELETSRFKRDLNY